MLARLLIKLPAEQRFQALCPTKLVRKCFFLGMLQPIPPLYSSGDKMVVKDNCPVFDAWLVVSEQAISIEFLRLNLGRTFQPMLHFFARMSA